MATAAGILNDWLLTMNQCTLSGNSATEGGGGGGIYNDGTLTLNQCTLSGNSATGGGGIFNDYYYTTLAMTNTLSLEIAAPMARIFIIIILHLNLWRLESRPVGCQQPRHDCRSPLPSPTLPTSPRSAITAGRRKRCRRCPGSPAIGAGSVAANNLRHRPTRLSTNAERAD